MSSQEEAAESGRPRKRRVRRLGDFTLVQELGRGGMGVVYRARQESLARDVALKVLPSFAGMEPAAVQRFRREAEAAARLAHPGIVPVYGVGQIGGIHYYAMELVEGPSLAALLTELAGRQPARLLGSLAEEAGVAELYPDLADPPGNDTVGSRYARSCAALAADVANALAAAHAGRIIHRDLKPSNVMIQGTGRPVLLDFGLARDELGVSLTRSGDAVGTPSYMAPEQACGSKDLDARVDVYGLGALLYELLTLRPPFDGNHAGDIMRRILDEEPVRVRRLNPRVPPELERIVHTCLAKQPDHRYASVDGLERDLRAFLAGRDVAARPPSRLERLQIMLRSNAKSVAVAVATIVLAGAVGMTAGVVVKKRNREQGQQALAQARVALLHDQNVLETQRLLGQAMALLDDPELVRSTRLGLVHDAFDELYPQQRYDVLQQLLGSLPAGDRGEVADLAARVAGRGSLDVHWPDGVDPATTELAVRRLRSAADGILEPEWQTLHDGSTLPLGDYLLRALRKGHAPVLLPVRVVRDTATPVAVDGVASEQLTPEMVQVVDPDSGLPFAIARTELSHATYQQMLDGLTAGGLRAELTPEGWNADADGRLPVAGLSFAQARAAAAHLGAHLPNEHEFRLAATAGLPLRYPWGGVLDRARVAADPDALSAPVAVDTDLGGASVLGVQHLLGNVAEILSSPPELAIPLAGGYFQSDPTQLRMDAPDLIASLPDVISARPCAGMRLAWFLPPPADPAFEKQLAERRSELLDGSSGAVLHEWSVDELGNVRYELTVAGAIKGNDPFLDLPLVTTGFQQISTPKVRDGHGKELLAQRSGPLHLEASSLRVNLPAGTRAGQGYRMSITTDLRALGGLRGDGDGWVMRVPVKAAGLFPIQQTLRLPPHSQVDAVEPTPKWRGFVGGAPVLVWEFVPDAAGARVLPTMVRFRHDGMLTDRWPERAQAERTEQQIIEALNGGVRLLVPMLDPSYLQLPSGIDFREVVRSAGGSGVGYRNVRLVDVTAVGAVETLDLLADWTAHFADHDVDIHDWPLRLQILREAAGTHLLRVVPRGRMDGGRILQDGTYENQGLKVTLAPREVQLSRMQDELTEMQVAFLPVQRKRIRDVRFEVLGYRADADKVAPDAIPVWLTSGAIALRRGEEVQDSQVDLIGPLGSQVKGQSRHMLFGRDGAGWTRERWTFVLDRGNRHFLLRAVAKGDTRQAAMQEFDDNRAWFDAMAQSVVIH